MMPTLVVDDYLLTSKMAYGYSQFSFPFIRKSLKFSILETAPERGDVVIFGHPADPNIDYIKRVIGVPGDTVQVKAGVTYLNEVALKREKVGSFKDPSNSSEEAPATEYREFLPGGRSYLTIDLTDDALGDNTLQFQVPPGHYFVMGDNRDNSADSRFTLGYVPQVNIFAKAIAVLDRTGSDFPFRRIE